VSLTASNSGGSSTWSTAKFYNCHSINSDTNTFTDSHTCTFSSDNSNLTERWGILGPGDYPDGNLDIVRQCGILCED